MKKKIALIDGYGLVFRAYFSLPPLTRNDGTPVGAVYGFANMIIRLLAGLDATHIAMVFDSGSKTFRNEIYEQYKAHRPPCPADLIPQFPLVREAAEAFDLPILEKVGYEADDLIATIAKQAQRENFEVVIISSDKDLMQLVNDKTTMFDVMKNKMIGEKEVEEKFFAPASKVLDILALTGDSSDNIPGVRGIGPKTAAELINQYGSLENLLENLAEIKQEKRQKILAAGADSARLSKRLAALCETVPINSKMDDFLLKNIDTDKLISFLEKQNFQSLIARIKKELGMKNEERGELKIKNEELRINEKLIIIDDLKKIVTISEIARKNGILVIDLADDILVLAAPVLGSQVKTIFYLPLKNEQQQENGNDEDDLFGSAKKNQDEKKSLALDLVLNELKPILTDQIIVKIGYNTKEIIKFFASYNIELSAFDDLGLMAYLLSGNAKSANLRMLVVNNLIEDIEQNGFGVAMDEIENGKRPAIFADEKVKLEFYFFKNYAINELFNLLKIKIFAEDLSKVYYDFERLLVPILARMELDGILVDQIKLRNLSDEFAVQIRKLAAEIYNLAGEEFNIASPKQLAHILFDKLSLKAGKKGKSGEYSTNSTILDELDEQGHIIAGKILEWRHISKLKNTYTDALPKEINPKTGRIHSSFSNISTVTGRLSSNNPNLQNIPIRSEEGLKIRNSFIAAPNCQLISADYSQIELRVLAHIADIGALKEAFAQNKDIHKITAAQVFAVEENEVDENMRRRAKAINFGIIYGISAFGLARQLKISQQMAAIYIKNYFVTYPGIQAFMEKYQELGRKYGFVTTISGRKCFVHDINSKNPTLRGLAERLAINAPIQGSAADIIKKAMINLSAALKEQELKTKLLLQVHDELILEAPTEEVEKVTILLKSVMENAILLDLPLKVDIKISKFWGIE